MPNNCPPPPCEHGVFKWGGHVFEWGGGRVGGPHAPPTQTYAPPHLKPLWFFSVCGGGIVFLTFKWGAGWGGHVFEWGGQSGGGTCPPPTQTYVPPPKTTMFFSECVGEIDVKKWGGGQSGGGENLGGASGGASPCL